VNAADTALLRELLEVPRVAALGVLVDGAPYVGLVPFAVAAGRQALLVHASRLARHTRGLVAGAPFSALVHAPEAPGADPLQLPRVTFLGAVAPLAGAEEEDARARYLARFPAAEQTFVLPDFALYALRIREGRLVAGFARARDVSPGDLQSL
jgi:putative heme iron utilization protein